MGASLDDILTAAKNNVVATNTIAQQILSAYYTLHPVQIYQGQLPTAVGSLYIASSASASQITALNVCNTTAGALTYYFYIVPSGAAAGVANAIAYNVSLPAATAVVLALGLIIPAGGSLWGNSSGTGVTASVTGRNSL